MSRPGMYVVGLTFQRSRRSGFLGGAEHDAPHIAAHLRVWLAGHSTARPQLRRHRATSFGDGAAPAHQISASSTRS